MTVHFHEISEQTISSADGVGIEERKGVYRSALKRAFDVALVLMAAPIFLPLIAIFAAIAATDGHNPFYRQERVGKNGRIFWIWKLRSMIPDADAKLSKYLETTI